ncbi:DNA polymerase III subunit epsilon [Pseudalgibacter alginicilyticus]|uniref:DNA polymerase III subunit epsilon n=1 Tax=Pseudalgibacter alginicilyticus TaxID=1736674 RepID=A0A0P0D010_9FLAO|nr:3'-5' exonuclease [Pseudalgibacter alginicilyticus]ALJ03907.1 DNA polymerase III subunit epsilon [Pseudalgibacter alginicilyticus]
MIFDWFNKKNKNTPEFWETYLNNFKNLKKVDIPDARFVVFDTETTGFDSDADRILSIGAVTIQNKKIAVKSNFEIYLHQEVFKPETVKIHGILKDGKFKKVSELEAIKSFLDYIKTDVLVAHHARFDYRMVNSMLLRNGLGKLKNNFIDTAVLYKKSKHIIYQETLKNYSLDELAKELNVPIIDRHTASGDALITAIVFLKILSRLKSNTNNNLGWDYLLKT